MALEVFITVFQRSSAQYNDQWKDNHPRRYCREFGEKLKDCDAEKKAAEYLDGSMGEVIYKNSHIGYPSKLLQQIPRKECDNSILRCYDLVGSEAMIVLHFAFGIKATRRKRLVHIDCPRRTRRKLTREEILDIEGGQARKPAGVTALGGGPSHRRGEGRGNDNRSQDQALPICIINEANIHSEFPSPYFGTLGI